MSAIPFKAPQPVKTQPRHLSPGVRAECGKVVEFAELRRHVESPSLFASRLAELRAAQKTGPRPWSPEWAAQFTGLHADSKPLTFSNADYMRDYYERKDAAGQSTGD